jgi:hypothetical protein
MAVDQPTLRVLISSKQSEFEQERRDIAELMAPMPLLAANAAETWAPESIPVEDKSIYEARTCAIYVGLFGCVYSYPTTLEYQAAASNEQRELLIYIRYCPAREDALRKFLESVTDPRSGRTVVVYEDWASVRPRFESHLWAAVARMVQKALRLASPPQALGRSAVMRRMWEEERDQLSELGLPAEPAEACRLAKALQAAMNAGRGQP